MSTSLLSPRPFARTLRRWRPSCAPSPSPRVRVHVCVRSWVRPASSFPPTPAWRVHPPAHTCPPPPPPLQSSPWTSGWPSCGRRATRLGAPRWCCRAGGRLARSTWCARVHARVSARVCACVCTWVGWLVGGWVAGRALCSGVGAVGRLTHIIARPPRPPHPPLHPPRAWCARCTRQTCCPGCCQAARQAQWVSVRASVCVCGREVGGGLGRRPWALSDRSPPCPAPRPPLLDPASHALCLSPPPPPPHPQIHPHPPRAVCAIICTRSDDELGALFRSLPDMDGIDFYSSNTAAQIIRHLLLKVCVCVCLVGWLVNWLVG